MKQMITFQTHPFRFLLYLEWSLLVLFLLSEILFPSPFLAEEAKTFPFLNLMLLLSFGILGLKLPVPSSPHKLWYVLLNLFLIFMMIVLGSSARTPPFLYLIILLRSCLLYPIKQQIIISILILLLFLFSVFYRLNQLNLPSQIISVVQLTLPSFILLFILSTVFLLILMNTLVAERESRNQLTIAHQKLKDYALRIEDQATLEERNRIAREIHDTLGHALTALNLQLECGLKFWKTDSEKAYDFVSKAKEISLNALQDVRYSVANLRSDPLGGKTLEAAIESALNELKAATGMNISCQLNQCNSLSPEMARVIYRLVQEALTNISKHAQADRVSVSLNVEETEATLKVSDNGKGFDRESNTTGFGLQGMEERTFSLGGQFKLTSTVGNGCTIEATFPMRS